jgi:hypothetical protein
MGFMTLLIAISDFPEFAATFTQMVAMLTLIAVQ